MTEKKKVRELTVIFEPDRMRDAHLIEAYANLVPVDKGLIDSKSDESFTKNRCLILNKELYHE